MKESGYVYFTSARPAHYRNYSIHDSRYMLYWFSTTQQDYNRIQADLQEAERQKLILDSRTIHF